jgi:hypothetical protein
MYAAVIRAADRWRSLTVGEFEQRQRRAIREEPDRAHGRAGATRRDACRKSIGRQVYPARPFQQDDTCLFCP